MWEAKEIEELRAKVGALEKRVAELEAKVCAPGTPWLNPQHVPYMPYYPWYGPACWCGKNYPHTCTWA